VDGNGPKDKASDYYKDLILAIISTSALLITISLTLVTLSYTAHVLGFTVQSRVAVGYSSFLFLLAVILSTFSYQRMVGVLHGGSDFYTDRVFRMLMTLGWGAYVIGAVLMFVNIYSLAFGGSG